MTLPAKAGSFSGNGMTCSDGVAVYRWRLKAPSEPWSESEPQDIQRGVEVSTDAQAAGTAMPALAEGLGDLLAAARTGLRCAGGIHLDQRPTSFRRLVVEVTPLIGDVNMHPREFLTCFQSSPRAFLASRELPLGQPQPSFRHAQVTRIGDLAPIAEDRECCQPHIDTHCKLGHRQ